MQVIFVANELRCNGISLASMVLVSFVLIFFPFPFFRECVFSVRCYMLVVVFVFCSARSPPAPHLLCDHWFLSHTIAHFDLLIEFYVTRNINCATRRCHQMCGRFSAFSHLVSVLFQSDETISNVVQRIWTEGERASEWMSIHIKYIYVRFSIQTLNSFLATILGRNARDTIRRRDMIFVNATHLKRVYFCGINAFLLCMHITISSLCVCLSVFFFLVRASA